MLWGYAPFQEYSHQPVLQLHKNGFSQRTLGNLLLNSDFRSVFMVSADFHLRVLAFKQVPDESSD
jgi:hypothetical protein